jgi:hypothetical protein
MNAPVEHHYGDVQPHVDQPVEIKPSAVPNFWEATPLRYVVPVTRDAGYMQEPRLQKTDCLSNMLERSYQLQS